MMRRRFVGLLGCGPVAALTPFIGRARAQHNDAVGLSPPGSLEMRTVPFEIMTIISGPMHPPPCDTPDSCGFKKTGSTVTTMYCDNPIYSRDGRVKTPATSYSQSSTSWTCVVCNKRWEEKA